MASWSRIQNRSRMIVSHMPISVEAGASEGSSLEDDPDEEGLHIPSQLERFVDEGPSTMRVWMLPHFELYAYWSI